MTSAKRPLLYNAVQGTAEFVRCARLTVTPLLEATASLASDLVRR